MHSNGAFFTLNSSYIPLHALPLRLPRRYKIPDVPLDSMSFQCIVKCRLPEIQTYQVGNVLVPFKLGSCEASRLGPGFAVRNALCGAEDGAVEGESARALNELVLLA